MKLLNNLKNAWDALQGKSILSDWTKGLDGESSGATLHSAYRQSVWVYSCINTIATQVAQIPFKLSIGERRGEDLIEEGDLIEIFRRPHPQMNRFQFWQLWTTWLMLRGEAFVVPHYHGGGRGRKRRLTILNPDHFQHVVDGTELMGWRYIGYGPEAPMSAQVFLPEEVIHSKFPNPYNFWRGAGPNSVAQLAAATDYASAQFMKGLMLNNADTGVIAYTEQQPSPEQREAILAALRERKRKAGTADRPLILWGGFKVEKPAISSADMQFLENRKLNRQEICAAFGVPQELLGFTEDANRSVSDAARLNFVENRVAPLCEMLEADVEDFIDDYEADGQRIYGWFDVDSLPIMQKARRERIDSGVKLFGMGVPLNEINAVLDLGLSDLPHGEKGYLPFNLAEVGAKAPKEPKPTKEPKDDPAGKLLRMLDGIAVGTAAIVPPEHQCGAGSEAYAASIAGSVKNKTGKLRKYFFEQRARVLAKLAAATEKGAKIAKGLEDDIFDSENENAELLGRMNPLLVGDLEFGGAQLFAEIGLSDFRLPPSEAITFLGARENKITGINDETFAQLKESLQEGLAQGETFEQLNARVRAIYNDASDLRAETIALTETNTAVNGGRFAAMRQAKVERKGWQASNLENVRASHLRAEQDYSLKGIPLNEKFRVGGYDLLHPGDPNGPAKEVINCRCFTFAIIDTDGPSKGAPTKFLGWEEFRTQKANA